MSKAQPTVEVRNVTKAYPLGETIVHALRGASLEVFPGEMVGLTGPSGSGKSTLLNICGLIDTPDTGVIHLDGLDVGTKTEAIRTLLRRDKIGFVFQNFNLVPVMTVRQNVDYPLFLAGVGSGERRRRVDEQLEAVGLTQHANHKPDALSGGQRQRVAIARALIKRPSLVIADEPTASLDSVTADHVLALMRKQCHENGAALIMATHDVRAVVRCDREVVMRDGAIQ